MREAACGLDVSRETARRRPSAFPITRIRSGRGPFVAASKLPRRFSAYEDRHPRSPLGPSATLNGSGGRVAGSYRHHLNRGARRKCGFVRLRMFHVKQKAPAGPPVLAHDHCPSPRQSHAKVQVPHSHWPLVPAPGPRCPWRAARSESRRSRDTPQPSSKDDVSAYCSPPPLRIHLNESGRLCENGAPPPPRSARSPRRTPLLPHVSCPQGRKRSHCIRRICVCGHHPSKWPRCFCSRSCPRFEGAKPPHQASSAAQPTRADRLPRPARYPPPLAGAR